MENLVLPYMAVCGIWVEHCYLTTLGFQVLSNIYIFFLSPLLATQCLAFVTSILYLYMPFLPTVCIYAQVQLIAIASYGHAHTSIVMMGGELEMG